MKRVLIVNCYFDETRRGFARRFKIPHAMGPAYLAGAFSRRLCELRLHCEMFSGPLEDPALLAWPDMLVLTGLTMAFDRMLHLTAYARTLNPRVIVVAGGPAIRALPRYSSRFFDYCCLGDVEEMQDVIADSFGNEYVADEMLPRFDLAYWIGRVAHVESSRNCNFRCSFCSLTGEGRLFQKYSIENIRRQILSVGKKEFLLFIDNNFFGNDREFLLARLELLREMRNAGHFRAWGALVTNDFFADDRNLALARESGCQMLFSGVESFDNGWLCRMNKRQNTRLPQVKMIRNCLDAGIVFLYGLMLDVTTRPLADLRAEFRFILAQSELTLPGFLSLPIPYPGTPFFRECVRRELLLPNTRLRDLDSTTLSLRPLGDLNATREFVREIQTVRGNRARVFRHALGFLRHYRKQLRGEQWTMALASHAILCWNEVSTSPTQILRRQKRAPRTYVSTTEILDPAYSPAFPVASRYESYFRPTRLTNAAGNLAEEVFEDLQNCQNPIADRSAETPLALVRE